MTTISVSDAVQRRRSVERFFHSLCLGRYYVKFFTWQVGPHLGEMYSLGASI